MYAGHSLPNIASSSKSKMVILLLVSLSSGARGTAEALPGRTTSHLFTDFAELRAHQMRENGACSLQQSQLAPQMSEACNGIDDRVFWTSITPFRLSIYYLFRATNCGNNTNLYRVRLLRLTMQAGQFQWCNGRRAGGSSDRR